MKLTRRQLRKLITESYTPKVPRGLDPIDPSKGYRTDLGKPVIDYYRAGVTQSQINDVVDEFFRYHPEFAAGAMSELEMSLSLRDIAKEVFEYCLNSLGIGLDALYDKNGNVINPEHVEEVIRRYEVALGRPHIYSRF